MYQITVSVEGMRCGMCEAHINDAVRGRFPVKKVSSSGKKGETVLLCNEPVDEEALRRCIEECGYSVRAIRTESYEKKGLFSFFRKEKNP